MPDKGGTARAIEQPVKLLSMRVRLLPIIFVLVYLSLTVLLFAFGPWPWPVRDGTKLYLFLAGAHLALLLGYWSVVRRAPQDYSGRWAVRQLVFASLIANLVLLIPTSLSRSGSGIPDIITGLTDPGSAYARSLALRTEETSFIEYVRIILGPLLFLLLPLTAFYWQKLPRTLRIGATLGILGFLAISMATGTNKALADFVLLVPWLITGSYLAGVLKLNKRRKTILIGAVALAAVFLLAFFAVGQSTRVGSSSISGYFASTDMYADLDNPLLRDLPDTMRIGVVGLTSYLTQGYYALYLSLDEPFVPMFGVGNSMFLYRNAARLTGLDEIEDMPYPARIERRYGWDAYGNWSSIYPWIASDVSFPGTILVVFLIGRLFALSWLDTLKGANPFAVAIFAEFIIMLFYFPANNQVLQSGEGLISFIVILLLWLRTRRKSVYTKPPR